MIRELLVSSLLALSITASGDNCANSETELNCVRFVKNYDADTITVDIDSVHPLFGKQIPVRVLGIDSPEIKSKNKCESRLAQVAREFVHNQLKAAKQISLVNVQRDKYFRILADVQYDKKSLTQELLQRKMAYPYDGGTKQKINWCEFHNSAPTAH